MLCIRLSGFGITSFLTQIHGQHRKFHRCRCEIIMIPQGLHIFIKFGLAAVIICSAYQGLVILVESKDTIQLMPSMSVAYFQGIMIAPCHVPVQSSQNALIIIHQRLPSQLHEPRVIQMECSPSLVQYKTPVFVNQRILPHTPTCCAENFNDNFLRSYPKVSRARSLINPAGLSPSPRGDSAPFRYSPLVRIWAEAQK